MNHLEHAVEQALNAILWPDNHHKAAVSDDMAPLREERTRKRTWDGIEKTTKSSRRRSSDAGFYLPTVP